MLTASKTSSRDLGVAATSTSTSPPAAPDCYATGYLADLVSGGAMQFLATYACQRMMETIGAIQDSKQDGVVLMDDLSDRNLFRYFAVKFTSDCVAPQSISTTCVDLMQKTWKTCT